MLTTQSIHSIPFFIQTNSQQKNKTNLIISKENYIVPTVIKWTSQPECLIYTPIQTSLKYQQNNIRQHMKTTTDTNLIGKLTKFSIEEILRMSKNFLKYNIQVNLKLNIMTEIKKGQYHIG